MGRPIEMQRAKGNEDNKNNSNIYDINDNIKKNNTVSDGKPKVVIVRNMNFKTTELTLRNIFEEYGTVTAIRIAKDMETKRPKGFAHVEFSTHESTKNAAVA
jgi:nucleolin